ncbi:MAG: TlpA family protein disulfide reductase [Bacillota bacterium]
MSETKKPSRQRMAALLLVLMIIAAGCGGSRQPEPEQPEPAAAQPPAGEAPRGPVKGAVKPIPGYLAANFTATDVFTGEKLSLADLKGQVVFLNFWATWCPPCKAEMPEMEELHQAMGDKVRIIALGADAREPAEKMAAFAKAMGLSFTIAYDRGLAMEAYQVQGIPTSFFIDANGVIRARHSGPLTREKMEEYIAAAEKAGADKP